jgi:hypothetical protein
MQKVGKKYAYIWKTREKVKKRRRSHQKLYARGKVKPINKYKEERKVSDNIVPSVDANKFASINVILLVIRNKIAFPYQITVCVSIRNLLSKKTRCRKLFVE